MQARREHMSQRNIKPVYYPSILVTHTMGTHKMSVELTHLVVKWSAVRNQSEIETSLKMRGMSPFLFVKLVQQRHTEDHAKPVHRVRRSSGQPYTGTTRSDGVGGVGLALLAILVGLAKNGDIGRVGKKMVLRRIPIYLLSKCNGKPLGRWVLPGRVNAMLGVGAG